MVLDKVSYLKNMNDIVSLFEKSFKRSISPEFLKWRYIDNPQQDILVNVFIDNNIVVANYSASPCRLSICGQKVKTALSMTTMTHPMYTGRGLFTRLASELYDYMEHQRYAMIWGFPNNQSHHTFISKLQWNNVYEIPTMRLVVNKKYQDIANLVTDDLFELNYSNSQHLSSLIHVVKDKVYLQWRYAHHPINKYTNFVIVDKDQVSSFSVVKQYGNQLDIVDFQARDKTDGFQLMTQILSYAAMRDMDVINCWAPRHHFMHGICEKLGFINQEPITYLGARQLSSWDSSKSIQINYSDWFIQMGDSDVY